MSAEKSPSGLLLQKFPFRPTESQSRFFRLTDVFFSKSTGGNPYGGIVLKGYAGTGKTTVISTLVNILGTIGYKPVLLAPTGRAAKVMSRYAGKKAFTIHKKIYKQAADAGSGSLVFVRQPNFHSNTVFIVDEASMISDDPEFGARGLLSDLLAYVFEGSGNKVLFVGDTAQLPPVGKQLSPALDRLFLERASRLPFLEEELVEVMRQDKASGVLDNATRLREELKKDTPAIRLETRNFRDIFRMTGERLEDGLRYAYDKFGEENTIVITRSNKAAVQYNHYIRRVIHFMEEEIDAGERLMIVRNNYTVLGEDSPAGFLANGDFVVLQKIRRMEEMHGFRFADVMLRLTDYENEPAFEAKIFLDTLHSPTPALSQEENRKLYESVLTDYADIRSKQARMEAVRKDPYLNALQVKFAYALTCHKAQGGQWNAVFVDQGFLSDEHATTDFVRWLYTAMTRATDEAYLVNFHPSFFSG